MSRSARFGVGLLWLFLMCQSFVESAVIGTVSLPRVRRQGTLVSGSVIVPAGVLGVKAIGDIHPADYEDTTLSFWLHVERSEDGGQSWRYVAGSRWVGGPFTDPETGAVNPNPELFFSIPPAGNLVRFILDVPVSMRVGGTLEAHDVVIVS